MEQEKYKKKRYTVWLSDEAIQKSDAAISSKRFPTRSDFIEKAISFYSGYLFEDDHLDFLSGVLLQAVKGTVVSSENRIARLLFKIAVEMAKLEQMLASINDMDEETMRRLHVRCVNEVKKINGIIKMEDAVQYQREDE